MPVVGGSQLGKHGIAHSSAGDPQRHGISATAREQKGTLQRGHDRRCQLIRIRRRDSGGPEPRSHGFDPPGEDAIGGNAQDLV
jgi:hypothetical protein